MQKWMKFGGDFPYGKQKVNSRQAVLLEGQG
jgi:hypothetical protein